MKRNGYTLIELLMVAAAGIIVMGAIGFIINDTMKRQAEGLNIQQVDVLRRTMLLNLENSTSWLNTVAQGSAGGASPLSGMDCLGNGSQCAVMANQNFALYDSQNKLIYDATNPGMGLTQKGAACATYSPTGNDACPFRYDLRWNAMCKPGVCANPQIQVTGNLLYTPATKSSTYNTANYSIGGIYITPPAKGKPLPDPLLLFNGTFLYHIGGNTGTITLGESGGTITGFDSTWLICWVSGSVSRTGFASGTIAYVRIAWSGNADYCVGTWYTPDFVHIHASGEAYWMANGMDVGPWDFENF